MRNAQSGPPRKKNSFAGNSALEADPRIPAKEYCQTYLLNLIFFLQKIALSENHRYNCSFLWKFISPHSPVLYIHHTIPYASNPDSRLTLVPQFFPGGKDLEWFSVINFSDHLQLLNIKVQLSSKRSFN